MESIIFALGGLLAIVVAVRGAAKQLHTPVEVEPVSSHWLAEQKRMREGL